MTEPGGIPVPLLVAGPLLFFAAALAGLVLLRTSNDDKAVQARIDGVTAFSRPKALAALPSITRKDAKPRAEWRDQLTGVFGFSLSKTEQYSLAWYYVIIIGLVAGRVAVAMGSGILGSLAWVLMPVVTVAVSRAGFNMMASKRVTRLRGQFPDALGLIVRAVRVGVPVSQALRAVATESQQPTAKEFDRLADQISIGVPMEVALREMAERNDLPEYGFFAAALALQAQTGGGLSETLDLLAEVTRKRVAMQARGHALSAEARTSSLILGCLPVVSGGALYAINPDYIGILFWEESGRMILGLALLSLCTGMFVMRLIIRKSLG